MGEIPDADGIGKVGNPVCLVPGTLICANSEAREIQSIVEGIRVLGHDGKYHEVRRTIARPYAGTIFSITTHNLGQTVSTPEHHILALKMSHIPRKYDSYRKLLPDWLRADEMEKGDVVLYPVITETKDVETIELSVPKPKWDFKSKNLPSQIKVNDAFLQLAGYFVAEGYTRIEKSKGTVGFIFGGEEDRYANDVIKLVKDIFDLDPAKPEREHHSIHIMFYSARLARFFAGLFGRGAENKHIPHWMLELPTEKQQALLCGLWRGDGYIRQHAAKYVTASRQLAHQVKALLLRQRIIFSFRTVPRGGIHKENYCIYVKDDQSLSKLASILGTRVDNPPKKRNHHKSWFDSNYFYVPIRRIEELPYKGVVYNLEVSGSHSFVSNSLCLHNCGDLMWIFIKVKDNRLEDVKFKTFGCGAAVATSSMITEMAKGKTLEEGMKITRADVANELGGLPPIKMHCSNLAADGLHLAIEDYLKKKGLQLPKGQEKVEEKHEEHGEEKGEEG